MSARQRIPKAISEAVLKEYRHRCSICGEDRPQLHHIDEDPSNNVVDNLLPLCPNCHLTDIHDPTRTHDHRKVSLFRRTKDPFILDSRFHPIFERFKYIYDIDMDRRLQKYREKELCDFIETFSKGEFYSKKVKTACNRYADLFRVEQKFIGNDISAEDISNCAELQREVVAFKIAEIEKYCVELLRYQDWRTQMN